MSIVTIQPFKTTIASKLSDDALPHTSHQLNQHRLPEASLSNKVSHGLLIPHNNKNNNEMQLRVRLLETMHLASDAHSLAAHQNKIKTLQLKGSVTRPAALETRDRYPISFNCTLKQSCEKKPVFLPQKLKYK